MRNLEQKLKRKSIDYNKLTKYGFKKLNNKYEYKTKIYDEQFEMLVIFSNDEKSSKLIDLGNDEEYALVDVETSTGKFVGKVREEYEQKIQDIIDKCTITDIFKSKQSKEIIKYVKKKYNDDLEFLWEKYDDNAIWRNKENDKWYGALLTVQEYKVSGTSKEEIEIIDLRYQKEEIEKIVNNKTIFPGYHMNKKSWITIKLDNTIKTEEICKYIDNSYNIVAKNTSKKIDEMSIKVLEYLTTIPKGKVVTYKQVAEYLGNKGLARVVGIILHNNPDGDKYPCYKVLNSHGKLAEAFVFGGIDIQKQRLEKDGIKVENDKVDLTKYQWKEKE